MGPLQRTCSRGPRPHPPIRAQLLRRSKRVTECVDTNRDPIRQPRATDLTATHRATSTRTWQWPDGVSRDNLDVHRIATRRPNDPSHPPIRATQPLQQFPGCPNTNRRHPNARGDRRTARRLCRPGCRAQNWPLLVTPGTGLGTAGFRPTVKSHCCGHAHAPTQVCQQEGAGCGENRSSSRCGAAGGHDLWITRCHTGAKCRRRVDHGRRVSVDGADEAWNGQCSVWPGDAVSGRVKPTTGAAAVLSVGNG